MITNAYLTRAAAVIGLFAALVLSSGMPLMAQDSETPMLAPVNPAFLQYLEQPVYSTNNLPIGEPVSGLIPETIDLSHLSSGPSTSSLEILSLPTFYDLRTLGKLTAVRNQGSCGSCWSFATFGSLESSMMPNDSFDGSENNLKNLAGFDLSCCSGGNRTMSTAYLARWAGAVSESADPYNAGSCASPQGLPSARHIQDVVFIADRTGSLDNDALKQAVMAYGAVYTSYYHNDTYYNSSTYAYYYNGTSQGNHAVCIVGWDDNFDRNKFRTPAPANGAFIMRNSWGSYWGQSGYFYMSYYDSKLGISNAAFIAQSTPSYDQVYQYDTLGWVTSTGYGNNTAWFANVFTATTSSNISAAGLYASSNNASYELRVYLNPTSGPVSSSGPVAIKTGVIETAGYHTVALDTPVAVTAGQKFSVVVKVTTPGYGYPIPLEKPMGGFASYATASTGQSYMSSSGSTWTDVASSYANTNVCLKAFARQGGGTPPPATGALSVTPTTGMSASGQIGGPFSPTSATYTLTNTGNADVSWTANSSATWAGLSATSGTLQAGANATVTVSLGAEANSFAAGSYTGTVSFTNTTNGVGSTTRNLSLTVNPTPTAGNLTVTPSTGLASSGGVGGPFSSSALSFTLKNTGGTVISWTAANTQPWVTISSSGGTLNAGASATVTVSINSAAASLAAGSYSDTVSFTNATNGAGSATRPVSLSVTTTSPPPSGSYKVVQTGYSWVDSSTHTRAYLSDDSVSYALAIPFTFGFYGKSYTKVYVGSNGLIGFLGTGMSTPNNTTLPYLSTPNAVICPLWDDLNPPSGTIRYGTIGSAPNRRFVVSWVGVPQYFASTAKFSFQAMLCEGSNDIIIQYQEVAASNLVYGAGRSATVGIEDDLGKSACLFSINRATLANGMALRFTTDQTAQNIIKRPNRGR